MTLTRSASSIWWVPCGVPVRRRTSISTQLESAKCGTAPTGRLRHVAMSDAQLPLEIVMYIGIGTILVVLLIIYFVRRT
jgi:hypothetical protein